MTTAKEKQDKSVFAHARTSIVTNSKAVSKYIVTFAKTTSIKGLPRVINSELVLVRLVWLVAVVGFLTLAVINTVSLVRQYRTLQTLIVSEVSFHSYRYLGTCW